MPNLEPSPWWSPEVYADRRPFLIGRQRILGALRMFFAGRDFIEVETPILQISPGNETHLHAFATQLVAADGTAATRYLHTSPEFTAKKLLAAGEERLFTLARVFRNGERTALHHPEFTMLEWYRARESYEALMADCAALLAATAAAIGADVFRYGSHLADVRLEPEQLTVAEAFARFAGIDLLATLDERGATDRDALWHAARQAGIRVAPDDIWADVFTRLMVEKIEPFLGIGRPTILCEYPIGEAALARPKPGDPRVAERFELYVCGVELANAFGELTDAAEQRRRFVQWMDEKQRLYGERYPIDEDFLAALARMPEASGIALGLDRLVLLATGARRIEDVLWAPVAP
ncbi:EF-P lysine aminoacylase EpmA [Ancylobacter defluvii]|uniref:EF-P lysine aminoacylase GenX n=1 Tax=Ancylobacter defluvii TaxID=1282440 RepID=A0A9W6N9I9_9HYPH|nr:EF-P lysine aminoacylase EpmA [Ancylobacter defluvii]MBS7587656.1 EF-P lysine aminoacylase GenX [Ancylobacter defluvii]GLK82466.1 EF-P lysine aminoacylase GenX [Ancylobacter defluvii]